MSLEQQIAGAKTAKQIAAVREIIDDRIVAARQNLVEAEEQYKKLTDSRKHLQARCPHPAATPIMPDMCGTQTCPHCGGHY